MYSYRSTACGLVLKRERESERERERCERGDGETEGTEETEETEETEKKKKEIERDRGAESQRFY